MSVEKVQQYLVYSCFNENYKLYSDIVENFDQTEQITVEFAYCRYFVVATCKMFKTFEQMFLRLTRFSSEGE